MKQNGLKQLWQSGKPALCGWLSVGNAFTAEIMAAQGYDAMGIDLQHGMVDESACLTMLQSMQGSPATALVRAPWLDAGAIMKALDAGAYGVICPMINNRKQAEAFVSYTKYPPVGDRSFGPTRANFSAGADYGAHADHEVLTFAMIETREAMDNLQDIVSTPGLDAVYIGPADLTLALTGRKYRTGFDRTEPEMLQAIQDILGAAHHAGIRAALHCGSSDYALKAVQWGFDMVTISNDVRLLAGAAAASVAAFRSGQVAETSDTGSPVLANNSY